MSGERIRPYVVRTAGEVPAALLEPVLARAIREPLSRTGTVAGIVVTERMLDIPDPFGLDVVRERLLLHAFDAGCGLSLLTADRAALRPGLLVCDLDSTLVDGEGIDLLAAHAGRAEEVARLTEEAMRGDRDFASSLRERVLALAGVTMERVAETAASLALHAGAPEGLDSARARGWQIAIATGGFLPLARVVADRVGATFVAANVLEERDGVLTGRLAGRIVDGAEKALFLRQCQQKIGTDVSTIAIGDGANDRAMCEAAEVAIAYRPKPALLRAVDGVSVHEDFRVALVLGGVLGLRG